MKIKTRRFLVDYFLRPPVLIVGFVVKWIYWILVGWWWEPRYEKRKLQELEKIVRLDFSFLFSEHAGIVSCVFRHGWPVATVSCEGLLIEIYHWRDEYDVRITPEKNPTSWIRLLELFSLIEPEEKLPPFFVSFADASRFLSPRWERIRNACFPDFNPELKKDIANFQAQQRFIARQQSIELNRRLYGD